MLLMIRHQTVSRTLHDRYQGAFRTDLMPWHGCLGNRVSSGGPIPPATPALGLHHRTHLSASKIAAITLHLR